MPEFHVAWEIDLDADSHEEAAQKALRIHRDTNSIATVFTVTDGESSKLVDLAQHSRYEQSLDYAKTHRVGVQPVHHEFAGFVMGFDADRYGDQRIPLPMLWEKFLKTIANE